MTNLNSLTNDLTKIGGRVQTDLDLENWGAIAQAYSQVPVLARVKDEAARERYGVDGYHVTRAGYDAQERCVVLDLTAPVKIPGAAGQWTSGWAWGVLVGVAGTAAVALALEFLL